MRRYAPSLGVLRHMTCISNPGGKTPLCVDLMHISVGLTFAMCKPQKVSIGVCRSHCVVVDGKFL
jgi:hypothetical protein